MSAFLLDALALVASERNRQQEMQTEGRFEFTCADHGLANLAEEVGEVAREVLTQSGRRLARDTFGTRAALRAELVQVAAVAVAWIEGLMAEEVSP